VIFYAIVVVVYSIAVTQVVWPACLQAYWPEDMVSDSCTSGTANVWVAVSDVPMESGCLRYLPGSHTEAKLRPHVPGADSTSHLVLGCSSLDFKRGEALHMIEHRDCGLARGMRGMADVNGADPRSFCWELTRVDELSSVG
jgi:hypothetical protein